MNSNKWPYYMLKEKNREELLINQFLCYHYIFLALKLNSRNKNWNNVFKTYLSACAGRWDTGCQDQLSEFSVFLNISIFSYCNLMGLITSKNTGVC